MISLQTLNRELLHFYSLLNGIFSATLFGIQEISDFFANIMSYIYIKNKFIVT